MSIDIFSRPDVPVTVIYSIYHYEAQYMLYVIATPMVTTEAASGQGFLNFTAHVRSWLGSPNFCNFLSSPKADKSFIALLTKHVLAICERTFPLWEFVEDVSLIPF